MQNNVTQGAAIAIAIRDILESGAANRRDIVETVCWTNGVQNDKVYVVLQALEAVGVIGVEVVSINPLVWWN